MAFADIDKKANGAANGAALSLSKDQEARLAKLPKKQADRLRFKMLKAKEREAEQSAKAKETEAKKDEPEHEDEADEAEHSTATTNASGHTLNVHVPATAPVIVNPKVQAPQWFEVMNNITHFALVFVAGAASWALFGTIIKRSLGI